FKEGDKVMLDANPSVHRGMYFPRFHGKCGVIKGRRGFCYEVLINDLGKEKILIIHPIHLKKL
ncbi:MAG: 50S ribosomal protein L21e, partial [Candidatus Woesearchaeota archaeon]|nr:50S ribosomal protein L21e [Candidatus Woesearchaeota archaeon]